MLHPISAGARSNPYFRGSSCEIPAGPGFGGQRSAAAGRPACGGSRFGEPARCRTVDDRSEPDDRPQRSLSHRTGRFERSRCPAAASYDCDLGDAHSAAGAAGGIRCRRAVGMEPERVRCGISGAAGSGRGERDGVVTKNYVRRCRNIAGLFYFGGVSAFRDDFRVFSGESVPVREQFGKSILATKLPKIAIFCWRIEFCY